MINYGEVTGLLSPVDKEEEHASSKDSILPHWLPKHCVHTDAQMPSNTHHCFSLGGGLRGTGAPTGFCPVCFLCVFRVISVTGKISAAIKMFSHV